MNTKPKSRGHGDETAPQYSIGDIEARLAAAKTQADRLVPSLQKALSDYQISVMALESCGRQIYEWRANATDGLAALELAREHVVRETVGGARDLQGATAAFKTLAALKAECGELVEVINGIADAIAQRLEERREAEDLARRKALYETGIAKCRTAEAAFNEHGPNSRQPSIQ